MYFQFGFVIFWQKEIGPQAALKILVKLTKDEANFLCLTFLAIIKKFTWILSHKNQIALICFFMWKNAPSKFLNMRIIAKITFKQFLQLSKNTEEVFLDMPCHVG